MAEGTPLSSIGVRVGYMVGTSNVNPPSTFTSSSHFTRIYDLKTTPDFNPSPNTADATTFDNLTYTTYVDLLKDIGGALEFSANLTSEFLTGWEALITADVARTSSQYMWFVIDIPVITKSVYFVGKPSSMGLPSLSANSLMETTVYITPISEPKWVQDPTTGRDIWGETIPTNG